MQNVCTFRTEWSVRTVTADGVGIASALKHSSTAQHDSPTNDKRSFAWIILRGEKWTKSERDNGERASVREGNMSEWTSGLAPQISKMKLRQAFFQERVNRLRSRLSAWRNNLTACLIFIDINNERAAQSHICMRLHESVCVTHCGSQAIERAATVSVNSSSLHSFTHSFRSFRRFPFNF